ncbi:hypothetical protein [Carnobacterium maltaromaticum]|uniref:hypothetical protein n=1 Tax=Carnobacterium maltaromaticum TaxID=2751 RepID=UPI0012F77F1C|nr:hypothetical protein [Carnobacterium maltaromaticum]
MLAFAYLKVGNIPGAKKINLVLKSKGLDKMIASTEYLHSEIAYYTDLLTQEGLSESEKIRYEAKRNLLRLNYQRLEKVMMSEQNETQKKKRMVIYGCCAVALIAISGGAYGLSQSNDVVKNDPKTETKIQKNSNNSDTKKETSKNTQPKRKQRLQKKRIRLIK